MCTRYYMELSPELRPFVNQVEKAPLHDRMIAKLARPLKTEGEIRPTDIAPAVALSAKDKSITTFPMVWGFTNPKGERSPIVNCRVETAFSNPFWKESWERRRCVIPASYYFEWERLHGSDGKVVAGQKYMMQPTGSRVMYMAGLYQIEEYKGIKFPVFAVLTREAAPNILIIHDRMPLILPKEAVKDWLAAKQSPEEILKESINDIYFETAS